MSKSTNASNIVTTIVERDEFITIDCDKALPVVIDTPGEKKGDERIIYRPITDREKREIVYCTLAYGRSPILYRLFRLLILSMTKRLYPKQGAPNTPRSNIGSEMSPSESTRNLT